MNKVNQNGLGALSVLLIIVLLAGIGGGGWWLYQLGMKQGMSHGAGAMTGQMSAGGAAMAPAAGAAAPAASATVDPTNWGIPEGEDATRRHMTSGLKAGDTDPETGLEILYYHDPMVPGKNFDAPSKSPFMDMMLVPEYAGAGGGDGGTISVSSRIQQNLGVRTGKVVERELAPTISAVGAIAWNERGKFTIQARATGFVEKLYVRATLDRVRRGQPLFELYVPSWVAAQEDYLSLRRMTGRGLEGLVEAAKQRMRQVGMNEAQISLVEEQQAIQARTTIVAPASGVVTELMAREGSTVMPGMLLAKINQLSTVWAEAEVPESQASVLKPGSLVIARTPALPGESFSGKVQALLPQVDPVTRTRRARVLLANKKRLLVPGMFVQMELTDPNARKALVVPTEALVRTGKRTIVLAKEEDSFRPIEIETGIEVDGDTEILKGLTLGQEIVLSGQFLIDSEASLKGIEARLGTGEEKNDQDDKEKTYMTTARVEAVAGDRITVTHPPIKELEWPGMTMDFGLAPNVQADELTAGSEIEIEFKMQEADVPLVIKLRGQAK